MECQSKSIFQIVLEATQDRNQEELERLTALILCNIPHREEFNKHFKDPENQEKSFFIVSQYPLLKVFLPR